MSTGLLAETPLTVFSPLASPTHQADGHGHSLKTGPEAGYWEGVLAELARLRVLEEDWDGQGADAPAAGNLNRAQAWVEEMRGRERALPPSKVVPGAAGEVSLVWQSPGFYLEAEISTPNQVEWLFAVEGQPTRQWKTDTGTLWLVGPVF